MSALLFRAPTDDHALHFPPYVFSAATATFANATEAVAAYQEHVFKKFHRMAIVSGSQFGLQSVQWWGKCTVVGRKAILRQRERQNLFAPDLWCFKKLRFPISMLLRKLPVGCYLSAVAAATVAYPDGAVVHWPSNDRFIRGLDRVRKLGAVQNWSEEEISVTISL